MQIYFSASVSTDDVSNIQLPAIFAQIKRLGHRLTSGSEIVNLGKDMSPLSPEAIFQREKTAIDEADCVVVEVSTTNSDVGGSIVYALTHHKPVLALFYKDTPNALSAMIAGNPSDHLYLEHYDEDSLPIILKRFFEQVTVEKNRRGKLIVIDGGDGSGKTTQSELLIAHLKKQGKAVKGFDFPRYYSSFHGKIVGRFLAGEFGDNVSPYLASLAYALDRASAKDEMDEWLAHGGIIVSNRYATSNMAHQGARLPEKERTAFLEWIDELEYKQHKIPREDLVIYLHVPWKVGMELTKKKGEREYLNGKSDILEADLKHREEAEAMYLWLAEHRPHWSVIECVEGGGIMPKERIHDQILQTLEDNRILSS